MATLPTTRGMAGAQRTFQTISVKGLCPRPCLARCRAATRLRHVVVRAELQDSIRNVQAAVDSFFRRYDILSTGIGATIVTSYCVYVHGQDPMTALAITFTATVVALVVNELLFIDQN